MSGGSKSKEQRAKSKEWASYFDAERDRSDPPESTKEAAWQGLNQLLAPSAETATDAADSSIGKDADAADVSERDGENDLTADLPTTQETTSSAAEGLGKTEGAVASAAQIARPLGVAKLAIAFVFGGALGAATTATLMQAAEPRHAPSPPHDMRDAAPAPAASILADEERPAAIPPPGSSTDEPVPVAVDATPNASANAAKKAGVQPSTSAGLRPRPTGGASSSKNGKPHAADLALARERALIERARSALARGAFAQALAAANAHRQSFPDGRLAEEREVIVIRALAAQGRRDAAAKRAAGFRKTYPKSLLSPAVDGASPPEGH